MRKRESLSPPDFWLLSAAALLVALGLIFILDSSYAHMNTADWTNSDMWRLVKVQAAALFLGVLAGVVAYVVPLDKWRRSWPYLLFFFVVLLLGLLVIGVVTNGARSWYQVGPFKFQPSEPTKLVIVLFLAAMLSSSRGVFSRGGSKLMWAVPLAIAGFVFLLIVAQKDLGTALLYLATYWFVFFAAGAKKWLMGAMAILAVAGYFAGIFVVHKTPSLQANYIAKRIEAHFNPHDIRYGAGLQTAHALIGLSRGGILGLGMCEGREKHYIPAASTDYIFVTVGEELGFVGGTILLLCFAVLSWRGLEAARKCSSRFGSLFAIGITAFITLQVWINIAVVTNLTIATGLPLPFISYGGSSILTFCMAVGFLLSISRYTNGSQAEGSEDYESNSDRRGNGRARISRTGNRSRPSGNGSRSRGSVRR